MIQATTPNGTRRVRQEGETIFVDDVRIDWELIQLPDGRIQILSGLNVYTAELVSSGDPKSMTVLINGYAVPVSLKSPLDLRLEKMGMNAASSRIRHVISPMPGLITDVKVAVGDQVTSGAPLLVLEAMKMENVLQASGDAVVKQVLVKKGDRVEKGQTLVEF